MRRRRMPGGVHPRAPPQVRRLTPGFRPERTPPISAGIISRRKKHNTSTTCGASNQAYDHQRLIEAMRRWDFRRIVNKRVERPGSRQQKEFFVRRRGDCNWGKLLCLAKEFAFYGVLRG